MSVGVNERGECCGFGLFGCGLEECGLVDCGLCGCGRCGCELSGGEEPVGPVSELWPTRDSSLNEGDVIGEVGDNDSDGCNGAGGERFSDCDGDR